MVTFTGAIANDQIPSFYAISDVFMTASLTENNSISMLEALAFGLVAVVRYDYLTANQLKEGQNAYFFIKSERMGRSLREIGRWSDKKLLAKKKQIRNLAKENDIPEMVEKVLKVYRKAIKKNAQNRFHQKQKSPRQRWRRFRTKFFG